MKLRVRKNDYGEAIVLGAKYLSEDTLNSLEHINVYHGVDSVRIPVHLSIYDLMDEPFKALFVTESIDDVVNRLQELTRPIKKEYGAVAPHKIIVRVAYDKITGVYDACNLCHSCFLKSVTHKKTSDSSVELELEFIGNK